MEISICGLNCAKCDIYRASHGDDKLRDEIVEWFKKEHNVTVKPEQENYRELEKNERDWNRSVDCRTVRKKSMRILFVEH